MIELLTAHRNQQDELNKTAQHIFAIAINQDHTNTIDYDYASFGEINGSQVELLFEYHPTDTWDDFDEYKSMSIYLPLELFDDMSDDKFSKWFDVYFKSVEHDKKVNSLLQAFKYMSDVKDIDFLYDSIECIKAGDTDQETIYDLIEKYIK